MPGRASGFEDLASRVEFETSLLDARAGFDGNGDGCRSKEVRQRRRRKDEELTRAARTGRERRLPRPDETLRNLSILRNPRLSNLALRSRVPRQCSRKSVIASDLKLDRARSGGAGESVSERLGLVHGSRASGGDGEVGALQALYGVGE